MGRAVPSEVSAALNGPCLAAYGRQTERISVRRGKDGLMRGRNSIAADLAAPIEISVYARSDEAV